MPANIPPTSKNRLKPYGSQPDGSMEPPTPGEYNEQKIETIDPHPKEKRLENSKTRAKRATTGAKTSQR
jgi:hypothetical protein